MPNTLNAMGDNLWKEGSAHFKEAISVQMWESYIIYLTKDLLPLKPDAVLE